MIKILLLLLVLLPIPAPAASPESCIEMMRMYYLWLENNKLERAEKQLKVASRICLIVLEREDEKKRLMGLVKADDELIDLYERLMDQGLVLDTH